MKFPPWLDQTLNACPAAGSGVHFWIFKVARHLAVHVSEQELFSLIKSKVSGCGRPVPDKEIVSQIKNARIYAWRPERPELFPLGARLPDGIQLHPAPAAWPKADLEKISRIVANGGGLCDLAERSPIRFDDEQSHAEQIIDTLFPGNPLLCGRKSSNRFATRRRERWRGHLARLPLIEPNPMLRAQGRTKIEGRLSEHTLEQTARRVYLVVEFDFAEFARDGTTLSEWAPLVREWRDQGIKVADACVALHLHLAERLSLVAAVHSGGKSLHAWYFVLNQLEPHLRSFMDYAVTLGADHATWLRSQFVRLPDGLRENGKRQVTYYLDPQKAVRDE